MFDTFRSFAFTLRFPFDEVDDASDFRDPLASLEVADTNFGLLDRLLALLLELLAGDLDVALDRSDPDPDLDPDFERDLDRSEPEPLPFSELAAELPLEEDDALDDLEDIFDLQRELSVKNRQFRSMGSDSLFFSD